MDLSELFNYYGSDKTQNNYTPLYHTLLHQLKEEHINLLEIGIGTMIEGAPSSMVGYALTGYKPGGSLRAWRDYFPNGRIIGCDIQPDTQFTEDRIETYLCNSTKSDEVHKLMNELNIQYNIIIDDGSHAALDQYATLQNLYPYLKKGGIYVIEDIHPGSLITSNPSILNSVCNSDPYFFAGINNNLCVIYKNHLQIKTHHY